MRWLFSKERGALDPKRLYFFDESGIDLSMTRAYARSPQGNRVEGFVPKNWGVNVTLTAGIGHAGLIAPMMLQGAMTGEIFEAYVEQFVLRELKEGDVVVMDNLAVHKRKAVADLIESIGATLLFLPPYSPDMNPIELAWSKIKAILRTAGARTYEELEAAVVAAINAVTCDDIKGWFFHAGY